MKILQIAHGFPPAARAGVENYTDCLSRGLLARGHDVRVLTFDAALSRKADAHEDVVLGGLTVRKHPWPSRRRRKRSPKTIERDLGEWLRDWRPDVVAFQHMQRFPKSLPSLVAAARIPYVIHIHDHWWLCPTAGLFDRQDRVCPGPTPRGCLRCAHGSINLFVLHRLKGFARRVEAHREVLAAAALIVVVTEKTRLTHAPLDLPGERTIVLPPAVPLERISARPPRASGRLDLAFLGSGAVPKGLLVLFEALGAVEVPVHLHLHGRLMPRIERALEALEASQRERITAHGTYSRADLPGLLDSVDAVVLPSLSNETYGLVLDEALARRLPVIASRAGGMPERIVHRRHGLLVEPGDAPGLARAITQLARGYDELTGAMRFSEPLTDFERHLERVEAHYQNLVAGAPRAPLLLELGEAPRLLAEFASVPLEEAERLLVTEASEPARAVQGSAASAAPTTPQGQSAAAVASLIQHTTSACRLRTFAALGVFLSRPEITRVVCRDAAAGDDSIAFARRGLAVTCFESASGSSLFARKRFEALGLEIPITPERSELSPPYDGVYAVDLGRPAHDLSGLLADLRALLRPGGLLVVTQGSRGASPAPFAEQVSAAGFDLVEERAITSPDDALYVFARREDGAVPREASPSSPPSK